jgi:DNA polymerase-3 subunit gamma/tau
MAILRVIHASDLPDPAAIMERLASGDVATASAPAGEAPKAEDQAPLLKLPATFPDLVAALEKGGKAHIAQQLHDFVGLVSYAPPELAIRPVKPLPADFLRDLGAALKALTGTAWQVRASDEPAAPSLLDQEKQAAERLRQEVLDTPLVKAAFEAFPEAELAGFRLDEPRSA